MPTNAAPTRERCGFARSPPPRLPWSRRRISPRRHRCRHAQEGEDVSPWSGRGEGDHRQSENDGLGIEQRRHKHLAGRDDGRAACFGEPLNSTDALRCTTNSSRPAREGRCPRRKFQPAAARPAGPRSGSQSDNLPPPPESATERAGSPPLRRPSRAGCWSDPGVPSIVSTVRVKSSGSCMRFHASS